MFMDIKTKYETNSFLLKQDERGEPQISQDIPCYFTRFIFALNTHK